MSAADIKSQINDAVKNALKAREQLAISTLRMILAAIKQQEVDERVELDDSQIIVILDKMVKSRRAAIDSYQAGGRADLADKEQNEITIIQQFLPQALSTSEIDELISNAIKQSQAQSMKDMGKVMGILKPQLQGRADMGAVSAKVKQQLS